MIQPMKYFLSKRKNINLIIAGEDKVFYGGNTIKGTTYGEWAKKVLKDELEDGRVVFKGRLPLKKYARLLKQSDVHLYFSRPFVVSWSLLEAMSLAANSARMYLKVKY